MGKGNTGLQKLYIFNHNEKEMKNDPREQPAKYDGAKVINYAFPEGKKIVAGFEKMWKYSNSYAESKKKHKFFTKIDKTKWLTLIDNVIVKAFLIHKAFTQMVKGQTRTQNILIYCSNGQAGSAVLSSLAQIILDPYYRTFEGFKSLIIKEWIYFGHNFLKHHNLSKHII